MSAGRELNASVEWLMRKCRVIANFFTADAEDQLQQWTLQ